MMERKPPPQPIQLELGEKESEGVYANLAVITHSTSEFVIDFARRMPGAPKAKVHARIVMTPPNAVLLLKTLERNLATFEERFGKIKLEGVEEASKDIGFRPSP